MFMTEKEARQRLRSSANLLSRLNRGTPEPPIIIPSPYDPSPRLPFNDTPLDPSKLPPDEEADEAPSPTGETFPDGFIDAPTLTDKEEEGQSRLFSETENIPEPTEQDQLDKRLLNQLFPSGTTNRKYLNDDTRAMIGMTKNFMSREAAGLAFEVSKSTATANARGFSSEANVTHPDLVRPQLLAKIEELQNKTRKVAFNKLLLSLGVIDNQKIAAIKSAKEASQVAGNLARVVTATTPREISQSQSVNFHVFVPEQASLNSYDTIDIEAPITEEESKEPTTD